MTRRIDSLYICPWSFNDALCQSQSLPYIRDLADSGRKFALITFETGEIPKIPAAIHENIAWFPIAWDAGNALSAKVLGIMRVLARGSWICLKHRPTLIHSRTSLPAFMAVCLKVLFRRRFLYDADSLLSDEYADIGHLSAASTGLKFLKWSEGWARKNADEIIVLTDVMRRIYKDELGVTQRIQVIPCCVDSSKFEFSRIARETIREELGIADEPLLVYVGKAGSWYLVEETFIFFNEFRKQSPDAMLLIVSTDPAAVFDEIAFRLGIGPDLYFVRKSTYEKVREWLSAADVGLALIKQVPSKRGSSPVKLAEYLSCGLPVVITDRIGDCSRIINDNRVGAVLPNAHTSQAFEAAGAELRSLLADRQALRLRCQATAEAEFDLKVAGTPRYRSIYDRLLDHESG